jgi:choline kinase
MQSVLLAAGMATRLRPLTDRCPKCLLEIGGKSLLQRAVENLIEVGADELVMVLGYRAEMIRSRMAQRFPGLRVRYIENERFDETNNAYSLLLTESAVPGGFLLLDSDILFPSELLSALLAHPARPCVALDRHGCGAEEIKIVCEPSGRMTDISKTVDPRAAAGESIGFELFDKASRDHLFGTLRKRVLGERRENEFYEASFKEMIEGGRAFYAVDTSAWPAMEIDTIEDLERARALATAAARA